MVKLKNKWSNLPEGGKAVAHYVLSDIHGEGKRFHAMLKKLRLTDADTLYILGDVIDRGPDGVSLLRRIKRSSNMVLLLGNHEKMCLDYFAPNAGFVETVRWNRNGNTQTLLEMVQLRLKQRQELLSWLAQRPDHLELTLGDRQFYLVHGCPADNTHDRVWGRPDYHMPPPFPDKTVILGHTPVVAYASYQPIREHFSILHAPGFIDIDCGCGHRPDTRRLACLRLEDMEEFYT